MVKEVFPIYDVKNLKDSIRIEVNNEQVEAVDLGLEMINISVASQFLDESKLNLVFFISKTEIPLSGIIVNFKYNRDEKKYLYKINLDFDDSRVFMKWFAVIKGLHRARFKG